jgi:hypothetical protein
MPFAGKYKSSDKAVHCHECRWLKTKGRRFIQKNMAKGIADT